MWHAIRDYPTVFLRHTHDVHTQWYPTQNVTTTTYSLAPIPESRPRSGSREVQVWCEGCRNQRPVRLLSARRTVLARCLWLLLSLLSAATIAVLFTVVITTDDHTVYDPSADTMLYLLGGAAVVPLSGFLLGLILCHREDGVRVGWGNGHRAQRKRPLTRSAWS